jgi:hypothetical protein
MTPILNRVTSNTHFQQHLKSSLRHRHEQPRLERPPAGAGNAFRVQSVQVSLPRHGTCRGAEVSQMAPRTMAAVQLADVVRSLQVMHNTALAAAPAPRA